MAYDDEAKKLAIKAIGTVESNLDYISINYNDPITVGFMQWYGTRAASLLGRIRTDNGASWVGVENSLTNALDTNPATDSQYWTNRYLTAAEGESLRPVLNNNKAIQNQVAVDDMEVYKNTAIRQGMDPDGNTAAMIFFFCMYHQSPKRALQVLASAGPNSDIDRLYSICLNETVLGQYRTRYTTARNIIKSGDNSGIDDLPGEVPETPPAIGDNGTGTGQAQTPGPVSRIDLVGDALHIRLTAGRTIVAYPDGHGRWLAARDGGSGAPVVPPTVDPPTNPPPAGTEGQKLVDWMVSKTGVYAYSQGPTRLTPDKNGYTDCSALVHYAYAQVLGIEIGTYTGNQWNQGTLVVQGSKTIDENLLHPGDLIFLDWSGGRATVDHVEMYKGNSETIGHGGPGNGPTVKSLPAVINRAVKYVVRRHVN